MKKKLPWIVLAAVLIVVGGCMGCENTPSSTEITESSGILTATKWIAQEPYTVEGKTWNVLNIDPIADSTDRLKVSIYDSPTSSRSVKSATIEYAGDAADFKTVVDGADIAYPVKVTMSQTEEIVLSLTVDGGTQYFFSPLPGSKESGQ